MSFVEACKAGADGIETGKWMVPLSGVGSHLGHVGYIR
jgi:hypothetical protein